MIREERKRGGYDKGGEEEGRMCDKGGEEEGRDVIREERKRGGM